MSKAACHGRWFSLSSQGFTEHRLLPRGLNSSLAALARSLAPTHPAHLSQLTRAISHEDSATKIRLSLPPTLCWHSLPWRVRRGNGLVEVGVFCGRRVMGAGQARARPKQEHALAHVPPAGWGGVGEAMGLPRVHTHTGIKHVSPSTVFLSFLVSNVSPRYPFLAINRIISKRPRKKIQLGEGMTESIKDFDRLEAYGSPCHRDVSQSAPPVGIRHVAWRVRRA